MKGLIDLKIKYKLLMGFFLIALVVVVAGVQGVMKINAVGEQLTVVGVEKAPLVDAAMEIKAFIAAARITMEETMQERDLKEMGGDSSQFQENVNEYKWFINVVKKGGSNAEGYLCSGDNPICSQGNG